VKAASSANRLQPRRRFHREVNHAIWPGFMMSFDLNPSAHQFWIVFWQSRCRDQKRWTLHTKTLNSARCWALVLLVPSGEGYFRVRRLQ